MTRGHWTVQRVLSILGKGPGHLLNLGRWSAAQLAQRLSGAWQPSRVDEAAFLAQLRLGGGRNAVARHFRDRTEPNFCFAPDDVATIIQAVDLLDRARTVAAADDVRRGVFRLRGLPPVSFGDTLDWRLRPQGNTDWTWELNRHAYFVTLGRAFAYTRDQGYVDTFSRLVLDWLIQNPPSPATPNWDSSLEVAYRLNVWTWAYYHFRAALDNDVLLALVRGLWWHVRFLAANLERVSPNNHLLLEGKALAMGGLLFPEFWTADAWLTVGLSVVWREVRRQVRPDGGHVEQAPMDHQIIASELLELLVLLEKNGVPVPPDVKERFVRMLEFERALRKPDGQIPLLGDSALGDSYVHYDPLVGGADWLCRADLAPEWRDGASAWLAGIGCRATAAASIAEDRSQAFRDSGYFVMRAGAGWKARYLVFDCGPFGYPPAPGHGHADALGFELYADGHTLVLDPGVYSYHLGADWRNYFRSTAAHNTVTVDGLNQSVLVDEQHVLQPARARLHDWLSTEHVDFVDGSHDGYRRLPQPITHRRQILFIKPDYWVILDQLTGQGPHRFDLYLHLAPEASVTLAPGEDLARVSGPDGPGLLIGLTPELRAEVVAGSVNPIQGWVSRFSGEKQAAPVLRLSLSARASVEFCTVLYPVEQPLNACLRVERLMLAPGAVGLRLETEHWVDAVVVDRHPHPRRKAFSGYKTEARLACVRWDRSGGPPVQIWEHD